MLHESFPEYFGHYVRNCVSESGAKVRRKMYQIQAARQFKDNKINRIPNKHYFRRKM